MPHRQLGNISIHPVIESEGADFKAMEFFPGTAPEQWEPHYAWLRPRALDPKSGNRVFPMQSFLLRTKHHTIVVNTCVGGHKRRARPF